MRPIHTIVLHCSASDNPKHDNIATMRAWHKARGWKDVGYHYFVRTNGQIEIGRSLKEIGAHVAGHNEDTVGVCFAGLNKFTTDQMQAAHHVINLINGAVGHTCAIKGHHDYTNAKTCPNFDVPEFLKGNLKIVKLYPSMMAMDEDSNHYLEEVCGNGE